MFKTVRKGDASLQYTILPQTDQFFGSVSSPQPPDTRQPILYKVVIPSIFISICFCSILAISALLIMTQHESDSFNTAELKQLEYKNVVTFNEKLSTTTTNSMDIKKTDVFSTNGSIEFNTTVDTTDDSELVKNLQISSEHEDNIPERMNLDTVTDFTSPENKLILSESGIGTPPPVNQSDYKNFNNVSVTVLLPTTIDTSSFSTAGNPTTATILNDLMTNTMSSTNIFKRVKMPRVTLKLRENDTIPHMYMKAGIASYKKGNITTSVLAHGLSLEGLIFKTPGGTIKPWSKKCTFSDSAICMRLKRYCETGGRLFAFGLFLGAIASIICSIIILDKLNISPVRRSNVEEPPLNAANDAKQKKILKSIGPETKLVDEKE